MHELLGIPLKKVEKQSSVKLINAIIKQRSIKSNEEINEIKSALNITNLIHLKSMTATQPGKYEYEVVSEMEKIIKDNAVELNHTAAISKKNYLHPGFLEYYTDNTEEFYNMSKNYS